MPSLVFKDAEQARDSICIEDQRKIRDLYAEWADKVAERAEFYEKKTTASSYWQQQQMLELERQLRSQSMQIHKEIEAKSKSSMYMVADSVVGCNAEFLKTLGFKEEGINAAFTSVPNRVVSNIVTGQIYKSGWSLSKAIWTDNQKTLSDIYSIVAQGRAMNMSAYEVSKMLERYVSPSRKMQWNFKMNDGVKIYKKTVDYNAQRLVRTLNQHAYQQSVIQVAKDNPFIQGIYWRANGSRVCPLCMDRDGNFYKWNEVPMDHPNGMCTMEPAIDMDKTIDQLADWIKEPDGTYPEIDKFAEKLGYEPISKIPNGFEDRAEAYVGGGYSGPEDIFTSKDLEYIYTNMDETRKTLYRVEDSEFTADRLDNDELDIDGFRFNGLRSFTEDKDVIREMLDENSDNWAGIENPVIFEITGKKDRFDMQEFTKGYTLMDQKESLAGGKYKYKVVGEDIQRMKGIFVRVIKIKQI